MKYSLYPRLLTILLALLLNWAVLSYFDMVPQSIALPLPAHSKYRMLPATGRDFEQAMLRYYREETMPKNCFDKIHSTNPYSAHLYAYAEKKNRFYFFMQIREGCYQLKTGSKSDVLFITKRGLYIRCKKLEMYFTEPDEPYIRIKEGWYTRIKFNESYKTDDSSFDVNLLVNLLKKQQNEKITIEEYSILLQSRYNGQLLGWFPDDHIAVIKRSLSDDEVFRINVNDKSQQTVRYGQDARVIGCADTEYLALYWRATNEIGVISLLTGEKDVRFQDSRINEPAIGYDKSGALIFAFIAYGKNGNKDNLVLGNMQNGKITESHAVVNGEDFYYNTPIIMEDYVIVSAYPWRDINSPIWCNWLKKTPAK